MEQVRVNNKRDEGFSLIELIVVIAIMAVLVLLSTPRYLRYTDDAKVIIMQSNARMLSDAIEQYGVQHSNTLPVKDDMVHWEEDIATETKDLIFQDYRDAVGNDFVYEDEIKNDTELKFIDEDKISSVAKDVENNTKEYVLVTEGPLTGGVYHKEGFRDSSGNYRNGLSIINKLSDTENENAQSEQEIVQAKHPFFSQYGTIVDYLNKNETANLRKVYDYFSEYKVGALFVFKNISSEELEENDKYHFVYAYDNNIEIIYVYDSSRPEMILRHPSRYKCIYKAKFGDNFYLNKNFAFDFSTEDYKLIDVYEHNNVTINSAIPLPDIRSIDELK